VLHPRRFPRSPEPRLVVQYAPIRSIPDSNRTMTTPHQADCEHSNSHFAAIGDDDLVRGCQCGCMECFAILFHRYCKTVFAIAWKFLRQKDEVEDLVQEVFLSIFLERYRYDPSRGSVLRNHASIKIISL
jgi:hypothetical protein